MLYAIVGMIVIILDQGIKYWVTNNIMLNTVTEPLIPGLLSLVRMHNDGAAFSFLSGGGARVYFVALTAIFTVVVILALVTNFISGKFGRWCLVLVTAGGLSNCLDRILYGFVVDMFKIDFYDFAVFNVADIFITVFSLLFVFYIIFGGETGKNTVRDEFDEEDDEEMDARSLRNEMKSVAEKMKPAKAAPVSRREEPEERPRRISRRAAPIELENTNLTPMRKPKVIAPEFTRSQTAEKRAPAERTERSGKSQYEQEFEQYKTARAEAAARRNSAVNDDPFAAWERANAMAEEAETRGPAARAMGAAPVKRRSEPVEDLLASRRAAQGEAAPKPAAKPASKPKAGSDDFSLDDILAEFK